MPYAVEKRDGQYVVVNTQTDEVKARHDGDKDAAERQVKLLHMIEHERDNTQ